VTNTLSLTVFVVLSFVTDRRTDIHLYYGPWCALSHLHRPAKNVVTRSRMTKQLKLAEWVSELFCNVDYCGCVLMIRAYAVGLTAVRSESADRFRSSCDERRAHILLAVDCNCWLCGVNPDRHAVGSAVPVRRSISSCYQSQHSHVVGGLSISSTAMKAFDLKPVGGVRRPSTALCIHPRFL
jgi:hypothetical protein